MSSSPESLPNIDQLAEGAQLLGGNIAQIMDAGEPGATAVYLRDVLADTEERVPASERYAVLSLLANEQAKANDATLIKSGATALESLLSVDAKAQAQSAQARSRVQGALSTSLDEHSHGVGRKINAGAPTSQIMPAHEHTSQTLQQIKMPVGNYLSVYQSWHAEQKATTTQLGERYGAVRRQEHAMNQAIAAIDSNEEAKQVDASHLVSADVITATAASLEALVGDPDVGTADVTEAIVAAVGAVPNPQHRKAVHRLVESLGSMDMLAVKNRSQLEAIKIDVERKISQYASRGNDEYRAARQPGAAADVYRQQTKVVNGAAEMVDQLLRQAARTIQTTAEAHANEKQRLVAVTKPVN